MISETTTFRESALIGRLGFIDTGTGTASVDIYGGSRPATADDPAGSSALVSIPLTDPSGTVSAGALTLTASTLGLVANTGVATWARVVSRDGATCFDMDVGADGSGAECILSATSLFAGGQVAILSATLS